MLFSLFLEIPAFSVSAFLLYRHRRISNNSSAGVYHCFSSYPRALLALSGCGVSYASFLFFGGYNKAYFDRYLRDISTTDKQANPEVWQRIVDDYMGMKPTDYKWNRNVISYLPEKQEWRYLGMSPYLPNCGSATVSEGNKVTLISGEIKPGLRTAEVKQYEFGMDQPWQSLLPLPAPKRAISKRGLQVHFLGRQME